MKKLLHLLRYGKSDGISITNNKRGQVLFLRPGRELGATFAGLG